MTAFISKDYLLVSILKIKNKYFHENFITYGEANVIKWKIQERINKNNIDVVITDQVDYFIYDDEIFLNVPLPEIEQQYMVLAMSLGIYDILYDEEFIMKLCIEIKEEKIKNSYLKKRAL